jgi:hypothetical protein
VLYQTAVFLYGRRRADLGYDLGTILQIIGLLDQPAMPSSETLPL